MSRPQRTSVQAKLIRVMVGTLLLVSVTTVIGVIWTTDKDVIARQKELELQIQTNLEDKGRLLAQSHATALAPLVSDNALSDVKKLVEQTVEQDVDVKYGLFLTAEKKPWAYASPSIKKAKEGDNTEADLDAWKELKLSDFKSTERKIELFGERILEFSQPVTLDGETLGTLRYGLSVTRLSEALERSRLASEASKKSLLQVLAILGASVLLIGLALTARFSQTLTRPLGVLTEGARKLALGDRSHRVEVKSGDEVEVLAGAFNDMLEENEKQFAALEQTTAAALEASRLKSEFLANMSHEIRTPMNGVLGMIKIILRHPLEPKVRRYADTVEASAHALMTIINDILDFSKMEAGKYTLQSVAFDLRTVVHDVAGLLSSRAQENGVELICRVDPRLPSVLQGDPDRIRQVINNLVGNAVKFTEEGEVFIDVNFVELEDKMLRLVIDVSDTGPGIPKEALTTLFEAFSQADGSMVRKHGGTGLGLSISQGLAQMMGGRISVESTLGVGSKFTAELEIGRGSDAKQPTTLEWTHGKRICVIEASTRWNRVIGEHLDTWGLERSTHRTPAEGLADLRSQAQAGSPYDAVLLGIKLSDDVAASFVKSLRAEPALKAVPVIALTQLGGSATLSEVANEIKAQVQKPLRLSELFNALQSTFLPSTAVEDYVPREVQASRKTDRPVLVVDDNEINRIVAVEELEYQGYQTDVACDGAEALEKASKGNYLLILMDCQMPVMDGYTAAREIRNLEAGTKKHTPIVALTAHAMAGERDRVLRAGMDDYLSKPFRSESLRRIMNQHVYLNSKPEGDGAKDALSESAEANSNEVDLTQGIRRSKRLVELFLQNIPGQIEELCTAIAAGDPTVIRERAHKLKGGCLALGAEKMASLSETLQHQAENRDLTSADSISRELKSRFQTVRLLLEAEIA